MDYFSNLKLGPAELPEQDCESPLSPNIQKLSLIEGVSMVGLSNNEVIVYVEKRSVLSLIPDEVDGLKIRKEVVGKIKPL